MLKKSIMILSVLALSVFLVNAGSAALFIGEFCWQKTPFADVIRLSVS